MKLLSIPSWSEFAEGESALDAAEAGLRKDIADLRAELKQEIADLRTELKGDIRALEVKIEAAKAETVKWVVGLFGIQIVALLGGLIALARLLPR